MNMQIKKIIQWLVLIGLFAGAYFVFTNLQEISDWLKLRNYQPPARIVKLADDTTMKDPTRRVFYVNHPELDNKVEFNEHCRQTEQSIILGCYIHNRGIYLLDVKEPRLEGVVEVTAAHEVLHAHYARLSAGERKKVDAMTSEFFKDFKDKRIRQTVENYRKKDPNIVPEELHSILGTEVRNLSPELEKYYTRYFKDRAKIVSYSEDYEQAFVDIESQAAAIESQLQSLKTQIDSNRGRIDAMNAELNAEKARLDALLAAGRTEEYNRSVDGFNSRVASYNALVNQTRQLINDYNALVEKHRSLAIQQQELYDAIDSSSLQEKL